MGMDVRRRNELTRLEKRKQKAEAEAKAFNEQHEVGTEVRYWTGLREGEGKLSRTRTEASVLGGHTSVVWVEDHGACIALSHVEPVR